jgi:hypothetical protein
MSLRTLGLLVLCLAVVGGVWYLSANGVYVGRAGFVLAGLAVVAFVVSWIVDGQRFEF